MAISDRTKKIHQGMINLFNKKTADRKKKCLAQGAEYRPYGNAYSIYKEIAKELSYSIIAVRLVIVEYHKTKSI